LTLWRASVLAAALSMSGCVGLPSKPRPAALPTQAPLSDYAGEHGTWPAPDWWKRYHDATLDQLIDMALKSSPTLAAARARFDSARQSVRIAGAVSGAHIDAVADADRQRLSDNGVFPPRLLGFYWYDLYDLGLQASYTFDWWGKQKDLVDAALDEAHAARAERSAAALMLATSVADAYFGWQADQSRLTLARERETTLLREAGITASRIHAELESADQMHRADSGVAAVREQIAGLEGSARLRVVAIAALVGSSAADLPAFTAKPLPAIDGALPDDVGIDLLARRADITASRKKIAIRHAPSSIPISASMRSWACKASTSATC
jgi:multidrug efflux system outer membrane protein